MPCVRFIKLVVLEKLCTQKENTGIIPIQPLIHTKGGGSAHLPNGTPPTTQRTMWGLLEAPLLRSLAWECQAIRRSIRMEIMPITTPLLQKLHFLKPVRAGYPGKV